MMLEFPWTKLFGPNTANPTVSQMKQELEPVADRTTAYRCLIPAASGSARLRVGKKFHECCVVDLSRDDFRVSVKRSLSRSLKRATRIELWYNDERWLVKRLSDGSINGEAVVQLGRMEELTRIKPPAPWVGLWSSRLSQRTDPRFLFALMLAFLVACVALPGIGDGLGTAPKVKAGVHTVLDTVKDTFK